MSGKPSDKIQLVDLVARLQGKTDSKHRHLALDTFALTLVQTSADNMTLGLWTDLESALVVLGVWFGSVPNHPCVDGCKLHLDAMITACALAKMLFTAQKVVEPEVNVEASSSTNKSDDIISSSANKSDDIVSSSANKLDNVEIHPPADELTEAEIDILMDELNNVEDVLNDAETKILAQKFTDDESLSDASSEVSSISVSETEQAMESCPTLFAFVGTLLSLDDVERKIGGWVGTRVMMLDGEWIGKQGVFVKWRFTSALITIDGCQKSVSLHCKIGVYTNQYTHSIPQINDKSISLYNLRPNLQDAYMIVVNGQHAGTCAMYHYQHNDMVFLDVIPSPKLRSIGRIIQVPMETRVVLMD